MNRPSWASLGAASALVAAGVIALPAPTASAASSDVVVSEVYGGGGNSGATLKNDFIELRNDGSSPVDVTGWSVQYASAGGTSWSLTALSGTIRPGGSYLVQEAAGSGGTTALPTPDASGTIAMSATSGKVALVTNSSRLTCSPSCVGTPAVRDFVGYGTANEHEGVAAAPGLSNGSSASRQGADTDQNGTDFVETLPNPVNSNGDQPVYPPRTGVEGLQVHDVQGASHLSPYAGQTAISVPGVVTAVGGNGFWMQSAQADDDPATSEGVFVFTQFHPTVTVGDSVSVTGDVQEFRPGGTSSTSLTTTELSRPEITVVAQGAPLPAPTIVGPGGRVPPAAVIEDDTVRSVEESTATFDPATDGIDFWESMEGMRVGIVDAQVVGPTSGFGELPVVPAGSGTRTARGGIVITHDQVSGRDDFNPERVLLDDALIPQQMPAADTGDVLGGTTVGVLDYSFANFKLLPSQPPTVVSGGIARESAAPADRKQFAIATYNVENLDPGDPQTKFASLADQIVHNLGAPDVVALEEVQDNNGPTDDGTTAADRTLDMLTGAIADAGGPAYDWRQIDPVNDAEGGEPGGNIRVAFLFRSDRGVQFVDRGTPTSTTAADIYTDEDGNVHLQTSPARLDPGSAAWEDSRVPLVGEFRWNGRTFFVVADHFASKGGDDPLFGRWQPPVRGSEVKRHQQAQEVRSFVDRVLAADPEARIAVVGDLNDFQFSTTADILVGAGTTALTDLPRTLPLDEQYTYVFEGNSQVLDHVLLSPRFVRDTYAYDIVHVNSEFHDQISDHDPQVVRLGKPNTFR